MKRKNLIFLSLVAVALLATAAGGVPGRRLYEARAAFYVNYSADMEYCKLLRAYGYGSGEIVYPDYYAGAYAKDQNALQVLTYKATKADIEHLKTITQNPSLQTQKADYSYNYLLEQQTRIIDYCQSAKEDDEVKKNISGCGVYERKNRIVVGLKNTDARSIRLFKDKVADDKCIEFEQSDGSVLF